MYGQMTSYTKGNQKDGSPAQLTAGESRQVHAEMTQIKTAWLGCLRQCEGALPAEGMAGAEIWRGG